MLAKKTPASYVAFDLLALGDDDYTGRSFTERRAALVTALADSGPSVHVTPATTDLTTANDGSKSSREPASTASSPNP